MKKFGIILSFMFIALLFLTNMTVHATSDEDDESSMSLYDVSSAIQEYLNDAMKPNEKGEVIGLKAASNGLSVGNAGAFVGYGDKGWISAIANGSSNTFTYSMFRKMSVDGSDSVTSSVIRQYCRYGYILGAMGLDTVAPQTSFSIGTLIVGGSMSFVYLLSLAIPMLFNGIFEILKTFNPFKLFSLAENMIIESLPDTSPLYALAETLSGLYDLLYSLSWAVLIPLFFAALMVSLFLLRTQNRGSKIKKYLIRIVFVAIGVPVLGALYTTTIDMLSDAMGTSNTSSTKVIASTFCDFEAWASNMRLAIPSDAVIEYTYDASTNAKARPSTNALLNTRATAFYINKASGAIELSEDAPFRVIDITAEDIQGWNTDNMDFEGDGFANQAAARDAMSLLARYMSGDFYHASDYETQAKADLKIASDSGGGSAIWEMFDYSDAGEEFDPDDNDVAATRFSDSAAWGGYNIFANGGISESGGKFTDTSASNTADVSTVQGLSTISMYNYLNTAFSSSNMVVYSSELASSAFVRADHKSVSLVGNGLTSALYWLNALALIGSFVIIGVFYAFSILLNNLIRGIRTLSTIPFAMFGSIRSIAKIITNTVMLIMELLGTAFVYMLISEILMALSSIIEAPLVVLAGKAFGFGTDATVLASGGSIAGSIDASDDVLFNLAQFLVPVSLIISTVLYVWFIVKAIKLRKVIVKGLNEASADIINKFLDVNGMPDNKQPGMLKQAAGSVASGAGMALGNKAMNGATDKFGSKKDDASGSVKPVGTGESKADGASGGDNGPSGTPIEGGEREAPPDNGNALPGPAGGSGGGNGTTAISGGNDRADKLLASKLDSLDDTTNEEAALKSVTGEVGAIEEENIKEQEKKTAKQERKKGIEQTAKGTIKAGEGAAKLVVGVEAGDAKTAVEGAEKLNEGANDINEGKSRAANAKSNAKQQASAQQIDIAQQNRQIDSNSSSGAGDNSQSTTNNRSGTVREENIKEQEKKTAEQERKKGIEQTAKGTIKAGSQSTTNNRSGTVRPAGDGATMYNTTRPTNKNKSNNKSNASKPRNNKSNVNRWSKQTNAFTGGMKPEKKLDTIDPDSQLI